MYCNAQAYGPGCPFSPHGKHVHPGDPKKCIYCGSLAVGPGCPFNPFSRNHVHGVEFNSMLRDSIEKSVIGGYLMNKLETPIKETEAYKMGIVDKSGKLLKKPKTLKEKAVYSRLDEYVFNLKKILGPQISILNSTTCLKLYEEINIEDWKTICENTESFKSEFKELADKFLEVVKEAHIKGLPTNTIEQLIIESFVDKNRI
jgi:hypothetical protein